MSAALARGCEQRRCCARWRAASLVLCVQEEEERRENNGVEGKTGAPSLLFMGDLRRSWVRDLLRASL